MKARAVPFSCVKITDQFWKPRLEINRKVTVPHLFDELATACNIRNLELAASHTREGYTGPVYMDSDLYKALEAACYVLALYPDDPIRDCVQRIIEVIKKAQLQDGYLNSYYQINQPDRRWTNLRDHHEMYCAGHLMEAAVAHYQATGRRDLLDISVRLADHIDSVFGSTSGKRLGYPGHPEIELALVKLCYATGERRYIDLARFLVDSRGGGFFAREHGTPIDQYDGRYWQDNVPVCDQTEIVGHAVRAAYLLSAVTDLVCEIENEPLQLMLERVWRNAALKRMFVTGGIGTSAHNEGFTTDYDLPNGTAYQETCASIAMVLWNHRMNLLTGDARYADIVERALYNSVLSGISLSGNRFFYVNPLDSSGAHHRQTWFKCACCPPNISRLLGSLGGYLYTISGDIVSVSQYVDSRAEIDLSGRKFEIRVETNYPWGGDIKVIPQTDAPMEFQLRLRVPTWCKKASVKINGSDVQPIIERGYIVLSRTWREGDVMDLSFPMTIMKIQAHPLVKADIGQIALQRGPIIYCLESIDQSVPLEQIAIPLDASFENEWMPKLLGGVVALKGQGVFAEESDWKDELYREASLPLPVQVMAVPYYAWDNREHGAMKVWMPIAPAQSS